MTFFSRLRQNSTLECKGKSEQKAGISKAILENINEPSNELRIHVARDRQSEVAGKR
jgi:hypothetical protein